MQHGFGFIARPVDPDPNGLGCLVLEGTEGHSEGLSWLSHDPRYYAKIPPLSQGSSCQYNSIGAFQLFDVDTQTATTYIPVAGGSKAHSIAVGYDSNQKLVLNIIHADGMAIVMSDHGITIKNSAGDAFIRIDASGILQNGNTKLVGAVDVGGTGAQPVINLTLFEAWWAAVVAAVSAVPVYGSAIGGAMGGMTAALPATGTTLLKGL
jgi:hypothetical protein